MMFRKMLIANRGDIACRVIATARRMGITTVAVYSDADADARHVELADEAVHIGPPPLAESYLDDERVVAAAIEARAEAVHPGRGLLAQSADFADQVTAAGLVFVGPSSASIRAMSMKDSARRLMERAGIAVVPGYHGEGQELVLLASKAREIGYPVLIRPRAGNRGTGMRKVDSPDDLAEALSAVRREAKTAFGDDRVMVEKYIERPRHIEVPIFGDASGNLVHLFERDCSVRHRHRKLIAESPAPGMTGDMRSLICETAMKAAGTMDYCGIGTVEFIADTSDGLRPDRFWFAAMDTQLPVTHAVTEMASGIDLVEWQLRIAAGETLPASQEQIVLQGHAMEARIHAEDPARDFFPVTGVVRHLAFPPESPSLRIEMAMRAGEELSHRFDPLIAGLVVGAKDRFLAIRELSSALAATEIGGVANNAGFLSALLHDPDFVSAALDTGLVARKQNTLAATRPFPPEVLSAALLAASGIRTLPDDDDPWSSLAGYTHFHPIERRVVLRSGSTDISAHVSVQADGRRSIRVEGEPESRLVKPDHLPPVACWQGHVAVFSQGVTHEFAIPDPFPASEAAESATDGVPAPLPGVVKIVRVAAGDAVRQGQPLLILEAMNMQHLIAAPQDGIVTHVVPEGIEVGQGSTLVGIDRDEFRSNRHELMNAIDSRETERDTGGKPHHTFPHPALEDTRDRS